MYAGVLITTIYVLRSDRSPYLDNTRDILNYSTYSPSSPELMPVLETPWERVERRCERTRRLLSNGVGGWGRVLVV